jgi:hypothetical protein
MNVVFVVLFIWDDSYDRGLCLKILNRVLRGSSKYRTLKKYPTKPGSRGISQISFVDRTKTAGIVYIFGYRWQSF